MAKVHLAEDARVIAVQPELDGATPIVPLRAVVLQLLAPPTTDEWEIPRLPGRSISFAIHPDLAREIGEAFLQTADALDRR